MNKMLLLDKILRRNPSISMRDIEESVALAHELRRLGQRPRGYHLPGPNARKTARSGCKEACDPRTAYLREV